MKAVTIYSDGGCEGNPGPGGWGATLFYGKQVREIFGGEPATTNNRMELRAAIEALRALREPCQVRFFTDSNYVREGITLWVPNWKKRKWQTKAKTPVKNQDLWQELDLQASKHEITWVWVKGHSGQAHNERCDLLAAKAMAAIRKQYSPQQLKALLAEFKKTEQQPSQSPGSGSKTGTELFAD